MGQQRLVSRPEERTKTLQHSAYIYYFFTEIGVVGRTFIFRVPTEDQFKQWLLAIHCTIAQVCCSL